MINFCGESILFFLPNPKTFPCFASEKCGLAVKRGNICFPQHHQFPSLDFNGCEAEQKYIKPKNSSE